MADENDEESRCGLVLSVLLGAAIIAIVFGIMIWSIVGDYRGLQPPEYSMAITGVAGLDLDDVAGDRHQTLSPVFNLTLRISSKRGSYLKCVPELSTVSASYGDAFLGKGSVGPFCVEGKAEGEGPARAWGQDVVVPRFLRDQLAGELQRGDAAVDVALRMPSGCNMVSCFDTVRVCKAKIRGGPPCLMY
ncbi:hypothetical protein ACQ4PT_018135 [Festuca glaucescens]